MRQRKLRPCLAALERALTSSKLELLRSLRSRPFLKDPVSAKGMAVRRKFFENDGQIFAGFELLILLYLVQVQIRHDKNCPITFIPSYTDAKRETKEERSRHRVQAGPAPPCMVQFQNGSSFGTFFFRSKWGAFGGCAALFSKKGLLEMGPVSWFCGPLWLKENINV